MAVGFIQPFHMASLQSLIQTEIVVYEMRYRGLGENSSVLMSGMLNSGFVVGLG